MQASPYATLDQGELLQLALIASTNNDSAAAIVYLKEAVSRPDATATAHFLLGSEYAQIKLYDRAVESLEAAIALDPGLSIARFQLGLLWLSTGAADKAGEVLQPLASLGDTHALSHFARGLLLLMKDAFQDAMQSLHTGISINADNPALNADMQKIIDEVNCLPPEAWQKKPDSSMEEEASQQHIFISAYTGSSTQH